MGKKKLFDEHGNEVKGKVKKPFYKKIWFWVIVVIVIFIALPTGSEDEAADITKVNGKDSSQESSEKNTLEETEYNVGDTVSYKGYDIKVNSVEYSNGGEYDTLDEGYEFVIVNITVANNTEKKQSYNPYDYKLNVDGNSTSLDSYLSDRQESLSSGELDPGASVSGNLYGQAKTERSSLKLQYQTSYWDDVTVDINLK